MKILKILFFSLLGFLSLYTLSNLFFADKFEVERSIEIKTTPILVFEQINNFKNWESWDPWLQKEPTMKLQYNEISSGVGAIKTWQSKNSSNGKMEIVESSFIDFVKTKVSIEGWKSFDGKITLIASKKGIIVSWKNSGKLDFLMRVMGPLFNKMIGKDLEQGLKNLKAHCESMPGSSSEVVISERINSYELSIKDSCTISNIETKLSDIFKEVYTQLAINGISPSSAPFAQYLKFPKQAGEDDFVILKAGVFIDFELEIDSNNKIICSEVSLSQTLECTHFGSYNTLNITHQKIEQYCQENGLEIDYPGYEFFETDPSIEPNLSKRETRVVYSFR
jgi:effector-binding domain-containing protein